MERMSFFTHEVHIPLRLLRFYTTHLPCLHLCHPPHNLVATGIRHRPRNSSGNLLPLLTSPTKRKKWWLRVGLTPNGMRILAHWDQIAWWQHWWRLPRKELSLNRATSLFSMPRHQEMCECNMRDFEGSPTLTPLTLLVLHTVAL